MAAVLVLGAGGAQMEDGAAPTCVPKGADTLALIAQSVPTGSKVPCISSYPAGWHFASMSVRRGRSEFTLDSDRAGISAVKVGLEPSCDVEVVRQRSSGELHL